MASYTVGTVRTGRAERPALHCSFCGKSQYEVKWLVAGPPNAILSAAGVVLPASHICDDCVEACVSTLKEAHRIERSQGRER